MLFRSELILFAREDYLAKEPETARAFLRAVVRGYDDAISKPDATLAATASQVEGETPDTLRPYLGALTPVLRADAPAYGRVNIQALRDYVKWTREVGVLDLREDPERFATNEYLPQVPANESAKP